jgi:hypothetical protein
VHTHIGVIVAYRELASDLGFGINKIYIIHFFTEQVWTYSGPSVSLLYTQLGTWSPTLSGAPLYTSLDLLSDPPLGSLSDGTINNPSSKSLP